MTNSGFESMYRRSITATFIVAFLVVSGAAWGVDWPQFRGPNADGISREKGINRSWQESPPEMLWKVSLTDEGYSGASVAFGKVFVIDHKESTDIVRAIDIRTGKDVWRFEYEDSKKSKHGFARATPLISGNKVYTFSHLGKLHCLDARTGKKIWATDVNSEFGGKMPDWGHTASLIVDGKKLIVCPGGPDALAVALDKNTGKTIWKGGGSVPISYATPVKATMNGTRQYLVFGTTHLVGVDTETGAVLWEFPWATKYETNSAMPIVIGNTVYITSGNGMGCALVEVSPDGSAKERWKNKKMQAHFSSPIYLEDFVYGNSDPGDLVCLDPQTGDVKWKQSGFEKGPMVAVDGVLLAFDGAAGDLVMVKMAPESYQELGRFTPLGGRSWTAPVASGGNLIVRNQSTLACFALR